MVDIDFTCSILHVFILQSLQMAATDLYSTSYWYVFYLSDTWKFSLQRPEFVGSYRRPLSSDAFSKFGQHDKEIHNKEVMKATKYLLQRRIPKVLECFWRKVKKQTQYRHIMHLRQWSWVNLDGLLVHHKISSSLISAFSTHNGFTKTLRIWKSCLTN